MKGKITELFCFVLLTAVLFSQELARTDSGRWIKAEADGTWHFVKPESEMIIYTKPTQAVAVKRTPNGKIAVWYDSTVWKPVTKFMNPGSAMEFSHIASGGYSLLLYDKGFIKLKELKTAAKKMILSADSTSVLMHEDTYFVNESYVDAMIMKAKLGKDSYRYLNYYYSGKAGNLQFITYCKENEILRYESDFINLLNGLVIYETDGLK